MTHQLGDYLRELRAQKKYSTRQLARLSGCSQSLITAIENGERLPSLPRLWQIVKTLDGQFGQSLFYLCLELGIPEADVTGIFKNPPPKP